MKNKKITTLDELLDKNFGKKGSSTRDQYEADSLAFRIGVMLKEARKESHLTQQELADKTGTKKATSPGLKEVKVTFSFLHSIN